VLVRVAASTFFDCKTALRSGAAWVDADRVACPSWNQADRPCLFALRKKREGNVVILWR
jgi:hypothetical protein